MSTPALSYFAQKSFSLSKLIPAAIWRQQETYVDESTASDLISAGPEPSAITHNHPHCLPLLIHVHTTPRVTVHSCITVIKRSMNYFVIIHLLYLHSNNTAIFSFVELSCTPFLSGFHLTFFILYVPLINVSYVLE